MLDTARSDVRYAWRQLSRAPVFTVVATLSLAVGIGVMVGGLALIRTVFFPAPAVSEPDELYHVYQSNSFGSRVLPYGPGTFAAYEAFEASGIFADITADAGILAVIAAPGLPPRRQYLSAVTTSYFETMGVTPRIGRAADAGSAEIMVTDLFWRNTLGGNTAALGQTIRVNGSPFTVVGAGPPDFHGTLGDDRSIVGWTSVEAVRYIRPGFDRLMDDGALTVSIFGRLASGHTASAATPRLNAIVAAAEASRPRRQLARPPGMGPEGPAQVTMVQVTRDKLRPGEGMRALVAIGGVVTVVMIVMLLACINVAGLLFARALARQHEIAVRLTLGASRSRMFVQLFTESVLLAAMGGIAGLAAVSAIIRVANRFPDLEVLGAQADRGLLLYTVAASSIAVLLFGVLPVLQSLRTDVRTGLSATHSAGVATHRARRHLLAAQIAVSSFLLVIAFAAVAGIRDRIQTDIGFATTGLLVSRIPPAFHLQGDSIARAAYRRDFDAVVASTPHVQTFAWSNTIPLDYNSYMGEEIRPDGQRGPRAWPVQVDANYFGTVGLQALQGRVLEPRDTLGRPNVVVANETYIRAYRKSTGDFVDLEYMTERAQIVGMVPDVAHRGPEAPPQPMLYYPVAQMGGGMTSHDVLTVRVTPGFEGAAARALERRLTEKFPDALPVNMLTMDEHIMSTTKELRMMLNGGLAVGAIELALAGIGLYGVLLFSVLARRRELGVRMALGARAAQAGWTVMRPALIAMSCGIGIGLAAGAIALNMLSNGGGPIVMGGGAAPFAAAVVGAAAAAAAAAFGPARKAANVSPSDALRGD